MSNTANDQLRVAEAVEKAREAFWASIAASYPEIKTGDMDPLEDWEIETAMETAVKRWVHNNKPGE